MSKINAVELYTENGITLYDVDGVIMTTTDSVAIKFTKTKSNVEVKLKSFPDYHEPRDVFKIKDTDITAFERANGISGVT